MGMSFFRADLVKFYRRRIDAQQGLSASVPKRINTFGLSNMRTQTTSRSIGSRIKVALSAASQAQKQDLE
jgi:hypothetical protein